MLSIKNNLMADVAARNLGKSYDSLAASVARLSSGLRINSAQDDAAGLAVRELIRADVAALRQGSRNAADGISMLQTAEGALGAIDNILIRMEELAEQASTQSYSSDQIMIMENEFMELASEIDRIVGNTEFNEKNLLNDASKTYSIHVGTGDTIDISGKALTADDIGVSGAKEFIAGRGTGALSDNYFTGANEDDEIGFTFDSATTLGGTSYEVTVKIGSGSKTLQQVVDLLNSSSRSLVDGWNCASAVYDNATGQYVLKLSNYMSGDLLAGEITINNAKGTAAVKWATALGDAAVELTHFTRVDGSDDVDLANDATAALTAVKDAIKPKDLARAELGYMMNRLEAAITVVDIQAENLATAEARISDVAVATEMANMTRTQVLAQAGVSMLAQANAIPQMALSLLR